MRDKSQLVAIHARFKSDPEEIAHTLTEEFIRAQQRLDGMDFEAQQRQFPYQERPYEQEMKRLATTLLGYEPDAYEVMLRREEPDDLLVR